MLFEHSNRKTNNLALKLCSTLFKLHQRDACIHGGRENPVTSHIHTRGECAFVVVNGRCNGPLSKENCAPAASPLIPQCLKAR